jgi:hypothetical protein
MRGSSAYITLSSRLRGGQPAVSASSDRPGKRRTPRDAATHLRAATSSDVYDLRWLRDGETDRCARQKPLEEPIRSCSSSPAVQLSISGRVRTGEPVSMPNGIWPIVGSGARRVAI